MALAAKAAADIECHAAHPRLREAEQCSSLTAHPVDHLGRGPDRHRVGARIAGADDTAALERHGGVAMVMKAAPQPVRGTGECRLGIASADRECADQVGLKPVMDDRAVRPQRRLRVDDGRQLVKIPDDLLGGVFGLVAALRDDDRDCLADMPHLVVRQ